MGGKEGGKVDQLILCPRPPHGPSGTRHTSHSLTWRDLSAMVGLLIQTGVVRVSERELSYEHLSQAASFLASGKICRKFEFHIVLESDWLKVAMGIGLGPRQRS